jgi:DNA-directed RNA polymerase subunit RPC12/RpoP
MVIYKTTNLLDNKIYIGQDSNNNPNYYGSGKVLCYKIKKYGKENFKKEILEFCETKEQLNEREIYWIAKLKSTDRKIGYNLTFGGQNGWTDEMRLKLRETKKRLSYKPSAARKIQMAVEAKQRYGLGLVSKEFLKNQGKISERGSIVWCEFVCSKCLKQVKGKSNLKRYHEENCGKYKEKEKLECPYCNKTGARSGMLQWHFEKCKHKNLNSMNGFVNNSD